MTCSRRSALRFLLVAILAIAPGRAEAAPDTFVRANVRADRSGRIELAIHKAYAGQLGPIRDVISLPPPDPTGYPKVEVSASGAVKAAHDSRGLVLVESTGPGLGEVDVLIVHNQPRGSWWLQNTDASGVGSVLLNVTVELGSDLHAIKDANGITIRSEGGEQRLYDQISRSMWTANRNDVPAGAMVKLDVAIEPDRLAPLWMTQVSLAVALFALLLAAYAVWRLRRTA